jgi:hypothetical protein
MRRDLWCARITCGKLYLELAICGGAGAASTPVGYAPTASLRGYSPDIKFHTGDGLSWQLAHPTLTAADTGEQEDANYPGDGAAVVLLRNHSGASNHIKAVTCVGSGSHGSLCCQCGLADLCLCVELQGSLVCWPPSPAHRSAQSQQQQHWQQQQQRQQQQQKVEQGLCLVR